MRGLSSFCSRSPLVEGGRADRVFRELGLDGNRRALGPGRLYPASQHLGDAPRLGDAAARRVRLLGIEDFTDCTEPELSQLRDERIEKAARTTIVVRMHLQ